jgi:hypothetical protein
LELRFRIERNHESEVRIAAKLWLPRKMKPPALIPCTIPFPWDGPSAGAMTTSRLIIDQRSPRIEISLNFYHGCAEANKPADFSLRIARNSSQQVDKDGRVIDLLCRITAVHQTMVPPTRIDFQPPQAIPDFTDRHCRRYYVRSWIHTAPRLEKIQWTDRSLTIS